MPDDAPQSKAAAAFTRELADLHESPDWHMVAGLIAQAALDFAMENVSSRDHKARRRDLWQLSWIALKWSRRPLGMVIDPEFCGDPMEYQGQWFGCSTPSQVLNYLERRARTHITMVEEAADALRAQP